MDKLKRYKLDNAFTDGVEITLDDAPDCVFLVRLPSQYNRAYTQAMYGGMHFDVDDDGNVTPTGNLLDTKYAQEDAFVAHCLIAIDGDPAPANFASEYPAALQELISKAQELASALDERVGATAKKSSTTSTGSTDGEERKDSTAHLKNVAS